MAVNGAAARLNVTSGAGNGTGQIDLLLTVEDVARILKLKPKQVYGLKIPCIRVSRRAMRFRQSVFEAWLAARAGQ